MSDICLYMATEEFDPVSVLIRERTGCDWSHVGFYNPTAGMTFSAMCDGKGVAWRPVKSSQKILLLDAVGVDDAFVKALTQAGKPYNMLDITGMVLGHDWTQANHFICNVLVLWAFEATGHPLLNMKFIPIHHFTPRDILLSPYVSLRPTS
jgi:hypothetical protein